MSLGMVGLCVLCVFLAGWEGDKQVGAAFIGLSLVLFLVVCLFGHLGDVQFISEWGEGY